MKYSKGLVTKLLVAQITLYIFLFFSFNNKTFFPPIILFALYLFWVLEDWQKAVWLTLVAVLPFGWAVRGLKAPVSLPFYFFTYTEKGIVMGGEMFFGLSLTAKFLILLFLFLAVTFRRKAKFRLKKRDFFLLGFLLLGLISIFTSQNPSLAATGFLGIFLAIGIYYLARYFLRDRLLFLLTINSLFTLV
ncbi:hypothetical protein KKI19_00280, partial [Patescibacteria group bacterium]|nr:hypothetical protein [Patescibacteria group bacterium]